MDIVGTLQKYDGKQVAPFKEVAESLRRRPEDALDELIEIAGRVDMRLQVGATWVLKDLAEHGTVLTGRQVPRLLRLLGTMDATDALLHALQTLPYLEIPKRSQAGLRSKLMELRQSKNAFVRAWAYNGLGLLAIADPDLQPEVAKLFDEASKTETAAVKARMRNVRKGFG